MVQAGFLDEVEGLLAEQKPPSPQASQAVGYAELIEHLRGNLPLDDAIERIKINTRRLAKSQRTWFKRFPNVEWFDLAADDSPTTVSERIFDRVNFAEQRES